MGNARKRESNGKHARENGSLLLSAGKHVTSDKRGRTSVKRVGKMLFANSRDWSRENNL